MLAKISNVLIGFGCLVLIISGLGITASSGRWYGKEWISEWRNEYGTADERVTESVCASAVFGTFVAAAAIAGLVLYILDMFKIVSLIVFAAAAGLAVIGMIPTGILLAAIDVFDEELSPGYEREYLWVPYIERQLVNTSTEFNTWFFNYWKLQLNSMADLDKRYIGYNVLPAVSPYFKLPPSSYWNAVYKRFMPVIASSDPEFSSADVYACVIDFNNTATVWDYQSHDAAFCETLNLVTSACLGRWNAERATESYKERCRSYFKDAAKRATAGNSAADYSAYMKDKDVMYTKIVLETGFACLYVTSSIFISMQVVGVLCLGTGIVLSIFFGKDSEGGYGSLNPTKLTE